MFDNGGCNQTCTNTTGSYKCSCGDGFTLNSDNHGCDGINTYKLTYHKCFMCVYTDIDECAIDIDPCEQMCNNNYGSYSCSCYTGYYLEDNGLNCTGEFTAILNNILILNLVYR